MKKSKAFMFSNVIFFLCIVVTIFAICTETDNKVLTLLFTLVPIGVAYLQSLIKNYDKAFIEWNKFLVYFINPSIEWNKVVTIETEDVVHKKILDDFFHYLLKENDYSQIASEKPVKVPSREGAISLKFNIAIITFSIITSNKIKIQSYSKINYRDSKDEINQIFDYVLRKWNSFTHLNPVNETYSLKVKFSKENPFYGLYVQKVSLDREVSFILRYTIDSVNYVVSNRSIEATTIKKEALDKISNNFLVLANS
ncbi:MAG: hypothetical protein ACLUQ0_05540 [Enterococcus italicus]|uniref:hypothetical protein n=1 Tax=Enterococcus italicus TaxID=246144 RepID=UPI003992F147